MAEFTPFIALGILSAVALILGRRHFRQQLDWPVVSARVLTTTPVAHRRKGRFYQSTVSFETTIGPHVSEVMTPIEPGEEIEIRYNPSDPTQCLSGTPHIDHVTLTVIASLIAAMVFWLLLK